MATDEGFESVMAQLDAALLENARLRRLAESRKKRIDTLAIALGNGPHNHITRDVTAEHYFDTTNLQWLQPEAQQIADFLDQQAVIAASDNVKRLTPRTEAA